MLIASVGSNLRVTLDVSAKALSQSWARLIQKICEVDPLLSTRCQGTMRIIAFVEDEELIEKILRKKFS